MLWGSWREHCSERVTFVKIVSLDVLSEAGVPGLGISALPIAGETGHRIHLSEPKFPPPLSGNNDHAHYAL